MQNFTIKRSRLAAIASVTLSVLALTVLSASPAHAASNRTLVASNGSDNNPCSRNQPCATFHQALSKTTPGGEVDVVDSADYGPINITFPVTIDGGDVIGRVGSVTSANACGAANAAICVSTGGNGPVVLRNLSVNTNTVYATIAIMSSRPVFLEKMLVQSAQVYVQSSQVSMQDSQMRQTGLVINAPNDSLLENVTITGQTLNCGNGGNLSLRHVTVTGSGYGIYNYGCDSVQVDSSLITYNGVGVYSLNGIVTISDTTITGNQIGHNPGDIISFGNNRITANGTNGSHVEIPLQ
jgi:hypothetical protein